MFYYIKSNCCCLTVFDLAFIYFSKKKILYKILNERFLAMHPFYVVQTGDVVQLLYRVSDEWLFGRCGPKEGMFPQCFIKVDPHFMSLLLFLFLSMLQNRQLSKGDGG